MELYRVKNGVLKRYNGGFVVLDNKIYTNPIESIVRAAGYKDLVYDEKPEYNKETHYLETNIEETDNEIRVHWILIEVEDIRVD